MPSLPKKPPLRIPQRLVYTTLRCAIAATLACSGHTDGGSTDGGPVDSGPVAHDSSAACDGASTYCGDGPCGQGAFYCGFQCPAGCDPFA
jgi:hypothetical protein